MNPRRAIIPDNTILLVYSVAPFSPDLYPLRGLCLALMTNIYCAWKISKCINHCQTLHLESPVFSHHHAVTIQKKVVQQTFLHLLFYRFTEGTRNVIRAVVVKVTSIQD